MCTAFCFFRLQTLSGYYFWRRTRDYRGCAWEWRKEFWDLLCDLLEGSRWDEVWTWKGVILLALSHWASGRCCTAHCIFQLQFQPSDHCKPLCDLISLEDPCSWASSFAPKISGKMERTWLWRRVRHPTRIHIILKSAQATTLCLLSEEDDRFITTMLIQLNYRFHQPRPACG